MGVVANVGADNYPKQLEHTRAKVCFNYDTSTQFSGRVIRDDAEAPGRTIIALDDGRVVEASECQWMPDRPQPTTVKQVAAREAATQLHREMQQDVERLSSRLAELRVCASLEGFSREDCAYMEASIRNAKAAAEQAMYRAGARTLELSPEDKAEALDAIARN